MKKSSKEIIGLAVLGFLFIISANLNQNQDSSSFDNDKDYSGLKESDSLILSPIDIDGDATGVGAHNWSWALTQDWCNFDGTYYVIENVTIDGGNSSACIYIRDSSVPFIIRNCTCYNAGGMENYAGILLENANNGTLIGNNCSNNNQNGITIQNCNKTIIVNNTANNNGQYGIAINTNKNCTILNNTAMYNDEQGIALSDTNNTIVKKNIVNNNFNDGISLHKSNNNTLVNNTANNNYDDMGISLNFCNNNTIFGNEVSNNTFGMNLWFSHNNSIAQNTANINSIHGIQLFSCWNNIIKDNIINDNNKIGINLGECINTTISGNLMNNNGIFMFGGWQNASKQKIDTSNLVNGKPVYYYVNKTNLGASNFTNAGQVLLFNCNDSLISDLNVSRASFGITLSYGKNNTISNVTASFNSFAGMWITGRVGGWVEQINITNCTINDNTEVGLALFLGKDTNISGNKVNNNNIGIYLELNCSNNLISENKINNNNLYGIEISNCINNKIVGNIVKETNASNLQGTENYDASGIAIGFSSFITIRNNTIKGLYGGIGEDGREGESGDPAGGGSHGNNGGDAYGIGIVNCSYCSVSSNNISNIWGGDGGNGGNGGNCMVDSSAKGGDGGNAGEGGNAIGIYLENSSHSTVFNNTIYDVNGGTGGNGGNGGTGSNSTLVGYNATDGGIGGIGGSGGNSMGILCYFCRNNITNKYNELINITGGDGSPGGVGGTAGSAVYEYGGDGGNGGDGGGGCLGAGIAHYASKNITNIWNNISFINGGFGGIGGDGGDGGNSNITGGFTGGRGGDGGNGNENGAATGLYFDISDYTFNSHNFISNLTGYYAGNGGNGGDGGNGFSGGDGGHGGRGGDGNTAAAILLILSRNNTYVANKLHNVSIISGGKNGGLGGIGGSGGNPGGGNGYDGPIGGDNTPYGFALLVSESNSFYHNDVYVKNQTDIVGKYNVWNNSISGNYWIDYVGEDKNDDGIGDTPYNLTYIITDDFGNPYFIQIIDYLPIYSDANDPPLIIIKSPTSNQVFGKTTPNFTLEIADLYLNTTWYSLYNETEWSVNYTLSAGQLTGQISATLWNYCPNGTVIIRVYANDTQGNIGHSDVTVRKDIENPIVQINTPKDDELFGTTPPDVDMSITDPSGIDEIWYQLINASVTTDNYTWQGYIPQEVWNEVGNGTVTIIFYANDSVGNIGYDEVTIRKEVYIPVIKIMEPEPYVLYGSNPPNFEIYVSGSNLDSIWYKLDNGTVTTVDTIITDTITENTYIGTIEQSVWDAVGNGTVTISFYINDTSNTIVFDKVTVRKDILNPLIFINKPLDDELFGRNAPYFEIYVSGSNLDTVWYRLDNGTIITINITITNMITENLIIGTIKQSVWDAVGNGTVKIVFYLNNTLGKIGYQEITVRKDIYIPLITIYKPAQNEFSGSNGPEFGIYVSGSNLDTVWYMLDNGTIITGNRTFTDNIISFNLTGPILQSIWDAVGNGTIRIMFFLNNSVGKIVFDEIIIKKDIIAPEITIIKPFPNDQYGSASPDFEISIAEVNLDEIWYTLDDGETNITITEFTGEINQDLWNKIGYGNVTIIFYARDKVGNVNFNKIIVEKTAAKIIEEKKKAAKKKKEPAELKTATIASTVLIESAVGVAALSIILYKKKYH